MAEEEGRGEGFLSRWSRLKQGRRGEAELPPTPAPEAAPAAPLPEQLAVSPAAAEAEPEIDLASLPRIDELTAGSDLAAFFRKGVPAALRNAALRRVWSVDPDIRDFIGPADYAWDWNVPGGAPGYAETIAHGPDVEALADRILGIGREPPAAPAEPREDMAAAPEPVAVRREEDGPLEPPAPLALAEGPVAEDDAAIVPTAPRLAPASAPGSAPEMAPPRPRHGGATPA